MCFFLSIKEHYETGFVCAFSSSSSSPFNAYLMPNSPESSLTKQTLSSPPALRRPGVVERPAPGISANEFWKSGVRLVRL